MYVNIIMTSLISHSIKHRSQPKDVFITPPELAKRHIDMVKEEVSWSEDCTSVLNSLENWYDPFKNSGNYFNQFPDVGEEHEWAEILENKDFFEYTPKRIPRVICSNPPYSMIDAVLKRSVDLQPQFISYLLCFHHLTTKRLEMMEEAGYVLIKCSITKVFKWYGMSCICIWERNQLRESCIGYDRKVWREEKTKKLK